MFKILYKNTPTNPDAFAKEATHQLLPAYFILRGPNGAEFARLTVPQGGTSADFDLSQAQSYFTVEAVYESDEAGFHTFSLVSRTARNDDGYYWEESVLRCEDCKAVLVEGADGLSTLLYVEFRERK